MGLNTPIPHSLKSEAKKAAKILREFSIPSAKTGPDRVIPGIVKFVVLLKIHPIKTAVFLSLCNNHRHYVFIVTCLGQKVL